MYLPYKQRSYALETMQEARMGCACAVHANSLYVVGGRAGTVPRSGMRTVESICLDNGRVISVRVTGMSALQMAAVWCN